MSLLRKTGKLENTNFPKKQTIYKQMAALDFFHLIFYLFLP